MTLDLQQEYADLIIPKLFELQTRKEYDQFFKTITKDIEFESIVEWSKFQKHTGWRILEKVYDGLDPNDDGQVSIAEEKLRQFLGVYKPTFRDWQDTVEKSVKNLIFNGSGNFNFFIDDYQGLRNIVTSWQSLGLGVYYSNIESYVLEKLNNNSNPNTLTDEEVRIANIFDNYAKSQQLRKWIVKTRNPNFTKDQLKSKIKRIDSSKRSIVNGRHRRNHNLARWLKILNKYECARCSKTIKSVRIEASHNIPLHLGIQMGGVDRSWNITVLCEECHNFEEMVFYRKRRQFENEKDFLDWLKKKKNARPE